MRTRALWAALAAVGAYAALAVNACGEVESCEQNSEPGCLNAVADLSGNCRFGLVNMGGYCKRPTGDGPNNDAGSDAGVIDSCSCPANNLCGIDRTCVNVCQPPSPLPVLKIQPAACRPEENETYDYRTASVAACEHLCLRHAELCGVPCNPAQTCAPAAAMALVTPLCATQSAECAMQFCEQARDTPCAQQMCPNGVAPNCTGVVCSNSCANPMFVQDGLCDDGDISNASSSVCAWGTDCSDCGPRRGTPPPLTVDIGDPCVDPYQCGGDPENIRASTGWCVPGDDTTGIYRCVPDCSGGERCPAGYECGGLAYDLDGDMNFDDPVIDDFGVAAQACFPTQCSASN